MIEKKIKENISLALQSLYQVEIDPHKIALEPTKADFEGDYTFVVFPYLKISRKGPEQTAGEVGEFLKTNLPDMESFNVIKGFLNISLNDSYRLRFLKNHVGNKGYGFKGKGENKTRQRILVEYSSPNTNKPLHLGHIRNNLLGYSIANILKANGHDVFMCNLINDRGIHICKSMLAWIKYGDGETPESSGMKGDHLVGKYYVEFDKRYKQEIAALEASGLTKEEAEKKAPLILEAQQLLLKWEQGDAETVRIWKMMNSWVYEGFAVTYKNLGVHFDKYYYESETYVLGKEMVKSGLEKKVFFKKDDGSVWIDLTQEGLDQKLVLRADGTSVYITQDIGTVDLKYKDFNYDRSIYVVGNEQDYHFKVLESICSKLGVGHAEGLYHLSYGMVELPHGKMKSREGTVVDADDMMEEMISSAEETTLALGKTEGLNDEELGKLYRTIGLGALKYFLLKVEPKKKMMFNPEESIDFQGNTGPFIQYTYARIQSILRNMESKLPSEGFPGDFASVEIEEISFHPLEKELINILHQYPEIIREAGRELNPGVVANYIYELAKSFSHFYHEISVLREENRHRRNARLMIAMITSDIIHSGFGLLGIDVPERM